MSLHPLPFQPGDILLPLPNAMNAYYGPENGAIYVFSKFDYLNSSSYCAIKFFSFDSYLSSEVVISLLDYASDRINHYANLFQFVKDGKSYIPEQNPELSMMNFNYMAEHHTYFKRTFVKISTVKEMDDYIKRCIESRKDPDESNFPFSSALNDYQSLYNTFRGEVLTSPISLKKNLFTPTLISQPFE